MLAVQAKCRIPFNPTDPTVREMGSISMTMAGTTGAPAVELVTGKTFDIPPAKDGDDLVLDLVLTDAPLILKLFSGE